MQAAESVWTTTLRSSKEKEEPRKATRMKIARKKKLKEPLPEFENKPVAIHDVVEDVLKYMKKKEKVVAKINDKKSLKLSERQEMEEVKSRILQIETNMATRFDQVERNMNTLKNLFDDMKRTNEAQNTKWESDFNSFKNKTELKSGKDKNKLVSTLQKVHDEHEEYKKTTEDHFKKVDQHSKKTTHSIVNGIQQLSDDLKSTKQDVDMLMKKRFENTTGRDNTCGAVQTATGTAPLNTNLSGFCSVDEGVDLLSHRMSKLDHRIAEIEQKDLSNRTTGASSTKQDSAKHSSQRRKKNGNVLGLDDDSVDTLDMSRNFEELEKRVIKTETAVAKLSKKIKQRNESYPHDSVYDYNNNDRYDLEKLQGHVRSVQRKLRTLGESTSRACRSLSVGVTDSQNATLQLFAWADKVHIAFDRVSRDCLKTSKNILPRAKLTDLTVSSANETKRGRTDGKQRRSASAGSQRKNLLNEDIDSDYDIKI